MSETGILAFLKLVNAMCRISKMLILTLIVVKPFSLIKCTFEKDRSLIL